ncbi:MAG: hypothetical protein JW860_00650 [Sedimentisphaerales bacterium]|nr:hypothetical protein [Sedimentisphaerales bacterium]
MSEQSSDTNPPEAIEGKLIKSLKVDKLKELASDYAELGLDSILDEGIVKDIPIIKSIASIAKIGLNIRDKLFTKKLLNFFKHAADTSKEQREAFIQKYCSNTKRFEETILLILEQADNIEKPAIIGKIFKYCILGEINYEQSLRLSSMVNKVYWKDLLDWSKCRLDGYPKFEITEHCYSLVTSGIYESCLEEKRAMTIGDLGKAVQKEILVISYKLSHYGVVLHKIING